MIAEPQVRDELGMFERWCRALVLDSGEPLILEQFQLDLLRDYFAGAVETLVLISKKNGKTTLLAALALYHLITTPDAECVIAAASRDQARILYDQAAGFVRRSPRLKQRVDVKRGYYEIRSQLDSGRIRVLAADVDTADGVIPTLALVDELGRHKSAELYGIFRDGLGPRGGRMLAISVAGEHEQTPLGLMRIAALKLDVERTERYVYARSADGSFVLHEWALDRNDDVDDMQIVKLANPASWQTIEQLQQRHDSPSMLPWQWARFTCGLWVGAESWWITADEWQTGTTDDEIEDGEQITLGFDGSRVSDATALVACRLSDGLVQPLACWQAPNVEGIDWEVPASEVDAAVADACERFRVVRGYFDPPLWQSEIDEWAHEFGEQAVMRYHTNRTRFGSAVERFRTDLRAGRLLHVDDPHLQQHVLNAQVRERRGGYWLAKARPTSPDKIDLAVAAVLAYEARADALQAGDDKKEAGKLFTFYTRW